jgi:isopenicillin N synthase-like dioxygenase
MDRNASDGDVGLYADFDNRYLRHDGRLGIERHSLATLPLIDLARDGAAQDIRKACIDIGFFYLQGHGFAASETAALLEWGRRFFALPRAEKEKLLYADGRGFMPPGGLMPAKSDKAPDVKERLYFAREFALNAAEHAIHPPAQHAWPDERVLPGFRAFVTGFIGKGVALVQTLARALGTSLGLDANYFEREYGRFGVTLTFNYYPPLDPATIDPSQWSFSPHTDYGTFALVVQDSLGGLQVRNAAGQWIDVVPMPETLVFNIGDLMALATNDLYTSNLHRVANFNPRARVSATLFVGPPGTAEISCLETCQGPGNPPRYPPVNADEYTRALFEAYQRTGRPGIAAQTARRLR